MFFDALSRRGIAWIAFVACLAATGSVSAGHRYIEVCPEDECEEYVAPRPPCGYWICRHLKLQSVYTWRKVTRPYRRIATVPPEMEPHVGPMAPPNAYTNPFGPPASGAMGESFGSPYGYPPTDGSIRYNYGPSAGSPGPAVMQYR